MNSTTLMHQKAFIVGTHPDFGNRLGESAEIIGFGFVPHPHKESYTAYRVCYKDGVEIYVSVHSAEADYNVFDETTVAEHLQPLIEEYKRAVKFRDGGYAVNAAYAKIKRLATPRLWVKFLEENK